MSMITAAVFIALALGPLYEPETHVEPKSVEVVAQEVCDGLWGIGAARRASLENAGYDYEEVQALVNEMMPAENDYVADADDYVDAEPYHGQASGWVPDPDGSVLTARGGVNYYFDQKETWYDLNMSGVIKIARAHGIGGEYWVREDGCKMLGDYIMLATDNNVYPVGTLVPTSLGMGISLDTGTFALTNHYQVDVATSWGS